jgi:organic radical activating enzyme
MKGRISEVFESIQGEGLYLGQKQIFVRFFGCNLACRFCDTRLTHFKEYTPEELLEKIKSFNGGVHFVAFTGGEPLLQKDFLKKILCLTKKSGYINYLETNGTLSDELQEVINKLDIVSMDLKLPSSTGLSSFWQAHQQFLRTAAWLKDVFLKIVVCLSTQEEDLTEALDLLKHTGRHFTLVLQPNHFEESQRLFEKIREFERICRRYSVVVCLIPQMHKRWGIK